MFFLYVIALNFVMCSQGYFCGVLTDNETGAQQINTFAILLFMLTSGGLGNLATFPTFIAWISYISPQRYALQGYFFRLSRQIPEPFRTQMVDFLGYNKVTDSQCLIILFAMMIAYLILGVLVINLRNRS